MKLSIAKLFEVSAIAGTTAYTELKTFVDYTNTLADQVVRALRNGLTFSENFNCVIKDVEVTHNIATSIDIAGDVAGILVIGSNGKIITGFGYSRVNVGSVLVTAQISTLDKATLKLVILKSL